MFRRARAVSRFYVAAPLSFIANGLLAGPLMTLQGKLGLRGWVGSGELV